ncbi:phospholipase C/P1 nuclease [Sistotremastrum niveocremeum HHB9708]|uniref:Phospholipase C/P1 nuclease n=2 Tax=Sistotremastraceae TaxID=3402574 RepID=A0A164YRV1_9AGAM|nr:phospholipase C/P1 nuclease [Sistotremastrum niveocremeum HHB9708]KZT41576.1 phospholipase C/P1 nuclease [Sistotremastrum suecicum HHB10207 ss-3]
MRTTSVILALGLASTPAVHAWGAVGHEIAATIAQMYLYPSTLSKLCSVLPPYAECHLAPVATWADKIRFYQRWSGPLHYVGSIGDHPSQTCVFQAEKENDKGGWENSQYNVLNGIRNTTEWILDGREGVEEATKFLVHFLGDMHQPLHLTGRDRGGNGMKVRFDGRQTNLHSVWDSGLIAKSLRTLPLNYTRPLPIDWVESALRETIYTPYIRQIMWEGVLTEWKDELDAWLLCPGAVWKTLGLVNQDGNPTPLQSIPTDDDVVCPFAWGEPIHQLNCDLIWPPELDEYGPRPHYIELDTPEYSGRIKREKLIEKLLAMAGIRMAGVLNYLFADESDGNRLLLL